MRDVQVDRLEIVNFDAAQLDVSDAVHRHPCFGESGLNTQEAWRPNQPTGEQAHLRELPGGLGKPSS